MGKVFISTLGVNDYVACNYQFNNRKIDNMRFIQEASIRCFCNSQWKKVNNDRFCILCTKDAIAKNWMDDGHIGKSSEGLRTRLEKLLTEEEFSEIASDVESFLIKIPDGNTKDEIWQIFQIITGLIQDNDEIYFDITHAFRSIPMLALVVLQYVRQLRTNVVLRSISYGAVESLGSIKKINEIPLEERNAPVFDLTDFANLMDWTNAVKDFSDYGQTKQLIDLLAADVNPLLKESKGGNKEAKYSKEISMMIGELTDAINRNKFSEIIKFSDLKKRLADYYSSAPTEMKVFIPIVQKIEKKIEQFNEDDLGNVFAATRWCIQHGMYQNAYSILLEGCISIALDIVGEAYSGQTEKIEQKRKIPIFTASKIRKFQEESCTKTQKELIDEFNLEEKQEIWRSEFSEIIGKVWSIFTGEVAKAFEDLNQYRNSFMHCGTGTNTIPSDLIKKLQVYLITFENWYRQNKTREPKTKI